VRSGPLTWSWRAVPMPPKAGAYATESLSGVTGGAFGFGDTGLGVPKTSGKDRLRSRGGMRRGRIEEGWVDGSRG